MLCLLISALSLRFHFGAAICLWQFIRSKISSLLKDVHINMDSL